MNTAPRKFDISEETKIVPAWAIILAAVVFIMVQVAFHVFLPHEPGPPPLALRIFGGLFGGLVLAFYILLIGYVNRDSGRRGMSRTLWTIIAIFVPNGIGFILYFLLRDPLRIVCPGCGVVASPNFTFCPKCRYELRPTCPKCGQAVGAGDHYCAHCGAEVRANAI